MALVLGVDSSTSACKVEVRDADDGRLVAVGRAPHPDTTPPRSEQDPEDWWRAFEGALAQAGEPTVAAVSVAAQQHGLVALGADGHVLRPAKLWNDTESAPDADWLVERAGGPPAWARACGSVPVASFTISKLSWLHRKEPAVFGQLAHVLLPHDWLTYRLTGELVTDRGDASGTGYFSPVENRWRPDLLAVVDSHRDWEAALPRVLGPTDAAGEWFSAVVAPGTGDNMAAALGVGLAHGDVVISLGTSGTVYASSDRPTADPTGTVAGFADATGRYLPLVGTLNAMKVGTAFARLLGVDSAELSRLAQAAPPGAGGLVLVPHLDGERTPNRPDARGLLAGIGSDVTREQVARAVVEGVVCNLLDGLDALAAAGVDVSGRLLLVGGGARLAAFREILAGLSGRAVHLPDSDEQVAAGAAVQAAAVYHGRGPGDVAAAWGLGIGPSVEPALDASTAAAIRDSYRRHRDR